jgi:NADH-quinone oxidoreductase subunit J
VSETFQEIVFWAVAVMMGIAAFAVVTTRNVIHAALFLVGALLGAAIIYVLLYAEFVAWAQVLVYVGAIVVPMLFGLMLTRAPIGKLNFDNDQRWLAALAAIAVFGVTTWIIVDAFEGEKIDLVREASDRPRTELVGNAIFSDYVMAFEVVSVLLLAALIGAIVIARREDPAEVAAIREGEPDAG